MQGHVTFRGLNKKKKRIYSIAKCAFLFILLVWAFKTVLVASGAGSAYPCQSLSSQIILSVLLWHLSGGRWHWCWSVRFYSPHREKALGGTQEGARCFQVLPLLPNSTFCSGFLFCFGKKKGVGGLVTWGLCLLPLPRNHSMLLLCYFYVLVRLAMRTKLSQFCFVFLLKNHFLFF